MCLVESKNVTKFTKKYGYKILGKVYVLDEIIPREHKTKFKFIYVNNEYVYFNKTHKAKKLSWKRIQRMDVNYREKGIHIYRTLGDLRRSRESKNDDKLIVRVEVGKILKSGYIKHYVPELESYTTDSIKIVKVYK